MPFSFANIPSLSGKVALVTGGSGGIGEITVRELAIKGAKVYLGARNEAKAQAAIERIRKRKEGDGEAIAARIHFLSMDLLDLSHVKRAADELITKEDRLDILICSAGIMATPYEFTKDGLEQQVGVNTVAHWLLTMYLLPLLVKTSRRPEYQQSGQTVRVVQVSSLGHWLFGRPSPQQSWKTLEDVNARLGVEALATWRRYGKSKTGNILIANTVKRLTAGERISSVSLHPGNINTELVRGPAQSYGSYLIAPLNFVLGRLLLTPNDGALSSLYAATSPDFDTRHAELNGAYLVEKAKVSKAAAHATEGQGGEILRAELNAFCKAFMKEKLGVDVDQTLSRVEIGPVE